MISSQDELFKTRGVGEIGRGTAHCSRKKEDGKEASDSFFDGRLLYGRQKREEAQAVPSEVSEVF